MITLGKLSKSASLLLIFIPLAVYPEEKSNNCLKCHAGIEDIMPAGSGMMKDLLEYARLAKTGNYCIVCHGGNPAAADKENAHKGSIPFFIDGAGPKDFYPDPGSPWVNENTCGLCHPEKVSAQWKSLMMTEAGKIQGTLWGFGGVTGYDHRYANYDVKNPQDASEFLGTKTYLKYMDKLKKGNKGVFDEAMESLPEAPSGMEDVAENPSLAAYTYLRQECQRCHLAVGGRKVYGDYRGMGCSACHVLYSNSGFYEGADAAIPKDKPGYPLVHSIVATDEVKISVNGKITSGIPVEICTTCHNRGRRIGVSYQGLMETEYKSPFAEGGGSQQKLHTKNYIQLKKDVHYEKGFLCQDCHTSLDMHSDNTLAGSITAAVEIECQDCHGTPEKFPWELPLGYGDEYAEKPADGDARGLTLEIPGYMKKGKTYPVEDGYLLTARGNPIGNAVKSGETVKIYLASGKTIALKPLKLLFQDGKVSLEAKVAMQHAKSHIERMECYACHATWAPQCYGCHLKIDYSKNKFEYDWVKIGQNHAVNGLTPEYTGAAEDLKIAGEVVEERSYLRWEDPPLGQNGEGRISVVVPGCQTTVTIIDGKGKEVIRNHIFKIKNVEGAGDEGQLAIDMAPLFPHTVQKRPRSCESCHANPKAIGYGIEAGGLYADPSQPHFVDLLTADGDLLSRHSKPQIEAIPALNHDWSRFVTEEGKQLQTVGHHLTLSRPLNNQERGFLDRRGVCLACHQEIPEASLAVSLLHHIAETAGLLPDTPQKHSSLISKALLTSAWVQVTLPVLVILIIISLVVMLIRKT